jgi:predicted dehydrogenase
VLGRATIGPLVGRLLEAIDTAAAPSPSLDDGLAAQAVLDAVLDAVARRTWVDVPAA